MIVLADGTAADISLNGAQTLGDVKTAIETNANVTVSFSGDQLQITDDSTPVGDARIRIANASGSMAKWRQRIM